MGISEALYPRRVNCFIENDLDYLNLRRKKFRKKVELFNLTFLMLAQGKLRDDRAEKHDIGVFVHLGVVRGGELVVISHLA